MNRKVHFWPFRQLPYNAQDNRILKEEVDGGNVTRRTWYVRDAAGQHLATYEHIMKSDLKLLKQYLELLEKLKGLDVFSKKGLLMVEV